jgi:alanyl-tRNA synthetase
MTERLYYTDAYLAAFDANVVATSDDRMRVYLDATAFYPTSGGQPHDVGTLGGVAVVDVVDETDRIAHVLAQPLGPSSSLAARVDWKRRFDHMQQHTGQHLLSAVFEDLFGQKTLSVHFGPDYATLDLDTDAVSREQLVAAERRANDVVLENRPVTIAFEDAATASELRKASDRAGSIRIVTIEGIDRSACGGTHVRSTGEIGPVLVRSTEKVRTASRVEFLCGGRALTRARRDYETLSAIAASLSASVDEAATLVGAQAERLKDAENARRRLEKEMAVFRARELYDSAPAAANGSRLIVVDAGPSSDELRTLALAVIALPKSLVVGKIAEPPSVMLAASEDSGIEAGRVLKEELTAVGGRGGGSPRIAQGSVPDPTALTALVSRLVTRLG